MSRLRLFGHIAGLVCVSLVLVLMCGMLVLAVLNATHVIDVKRYTEPYLTKTEPAVVAFLERVGLREKRQSHTIEEFFEMPPEKYWQMRARENFASHDEWLKSLQIPGYKIDYGRIMSAGSDENEGELPLGAQIPTALPKSR